MNYAEKMFGNDLGKYLPDKIERTFQEYGLKIEGHVLPKYTFKDGSYIETYGGEIITVNGYDGED